MAIEFSLVCAVIVGILSSARITRLITQDVFPPIVWIRIKWDEWIEDHDKADWGKLLHCHWCFSFWATSAVVLWGWMSDLHISWWIVNLTLAMSYVAAMVVERDEIPDKE